MKFACFVLLIIDLFNILTFESSNAEPPPKTKAKGRSSSVKKQATSLKGRSAKSHSVGALKECSHSPAENHLPHWAETHSNTTEEYASTVGGIPYPKLTASLTVGPSLSGGPILLQDFFLLEKTQSFNRERIPERVVHAKGAGAFGHFTVTNDITHITRANFLNEIGKKTSVAVRFSTVGGELGSADTWIDPKGFAVKFYTEEGVYDLVGNNLEVFPIRDPILFPDINKSRKRNAQTHLRDPNSWWDFLTLRPETTLHTLHLFSDHGTPDGYRRMDGAGVHTFKMVNNTGHAVYVKFHWKTNQERKSLTPQQSALLAGTNADYAIQDLYDAIQKKDFPSWDLLVQVMTFEQAALHTTNPFDITKHWRQEEYPLIPVGKMVLDQNPQDYFIQVEQIAMSPSHMVPGIEPSPDRMLHARIFSYPDAQLYRLGVNNGQLPVNRCPFQVNTYARDGKMNVGSNGDGGPNYFPNSFHGLKQNPSPSIKQSTFHVKGEVDRYDSGEEDNYSMAKLFWEKDLDEKHRQRVIDNIADFLRKADKSIQQRFLTNIAYPVNNALGDGVKAALEKPFTATAA